LLLRSIDSETTGSVFLRPGEVTFLEYRQIRNGIYPLFSAIAVPWIRQVARPAGPRLKRLLGRTDEDAAEAEKSALPGCFRRLDRHRQKYLFICLRFIGRSFAADDVA
jgi:hypothetical protein